MKATVILNQQAGSVLAGGSDCGPGPLSVAFSRVGIDATVQVLPPAEIEQAARRAADTGPDALVVGGGDGTISSVAGVLADTPLPLGILPLGTLNHFAKDLGIPSDWRRAVTAISEGNLRAVDLAEVNGRIFINNCSLGAYPDAVRRREALRELHGFRKWTAMAVASLQVMRRLRRLRVSIEQDGRTSVRRTPFVLIANNRYAGNLFARNLRTRLDAGELWVYTTHLYRIFPLLRLMLYSLTHSLDDADELEAWPTRELTLSSALGPLPVAADGEVLKPQSPLRFRIRPRALRVFVPAAPP
jgi:diacylglycerol kinase family enzyme